MTRSEWVTKLTDEEQEFIKKFKFLAPDMAMRKALMQIKSGKITEQNINVLRS